MPSFTNEQRSDLIEQLSDFLPEGVDASCYSEVKAGPCTEVAVIQIHPRVRTV